MYRIRIAKSASQVLPDSVRLKIQMNNQNPNLKAGIIKWDMFAYSQVLSNPRFENLHETFDKYDQLITKKPDSPDNISISLIAASQEVPDLPLGYIIIGDLVFDRVRNANPVSYGLLPSSFIAGLEDLWFYMTI